MKECSRFSTRVSPVTDDQGKYEIYFIDKIFDPDTPCDPSGKEDRSGSKKDKSNGTVKLSKADVIDQCKKNDSNYAAPTLHQLRLS